MKGLNITQDNLTNQQGVVKNEVRVNVLNQPYGGFPWLDMPQYANVNWNNAHNFYGDMKDLDAATLADVQQFFKTFYAPNNAAIAVVGDFDPKEALAMIKKYFGGIPSTPQPAKPDLTEPRQEQEKRFTKQDTLANRPAIAIAYHMPERNTPEFYAMGLLDQILLQGNDSKLIQKLVKAKGYAGGVDGGINLLGNMHNYNGPMLWMANLIHDKSVSADDILKAWDEVMDEVISNPIDRATVERALVKLRSNFYDNVGGFFGFGRADLLASFALFDDDPARINTLEDQFKKVTPELMQKTAREYLRSTNRTILIVEPKSGS
jgi:zinc protease